MTEKELPDSVAAERYRWLSSRFFSVDYDYGEPSETVITFLWPKSAPISADIDKSISGAMLVDEVVG